MDSISWLLVIALGVAALGALLWYLLWLTEGMYLGWPVVTWLYDWYADRYDRTKSYNLTYETFFIARPIIQRMQADGVAAPLVLDVATGTGRVPRLLIDQDDFQGRVIGLDISRRMLFHAAVKVGYAARAHLLWQTVTALPFPDDTFDIVVCLEAWEFFPQARHDLHELVRVLRPGGTLMITNRTGHDARLMPGKTLSTEAFHRWLADGLGLADVQDERWQVDYDLFWARKAGESLPSGPRPLLEILCCPACGARELVETDSGALVCLACETRVPVGEDRVIELHPAWQPGGISFRTG